MVFLLPLLLLLLLALLLQLLLLPQLPSLRSRLLPLLSPLPLATAAKRLATSAHHASWDVVRLRCRV